MTLSVLTFVNINGDSVATSGGRASPKKSRPQKDEYHNGWRVVGLPPGSLEEAKAEHERGIVAANNHNATCKPTSRVKVPGPWDAEKWMQRAKPKPVRSRPYEVPEAAKECRELALKTGWLCVEVVELKKERRA